jgi:plasmid maintenance system antidote protein VapI
MKPVDPSGHVAEVLRLRLEGISVRRIARHLQLARKTVHKILEQHNAPAKPTAARGSLLDPYAMANPTRLGDTPETSASVEST